MEDFIAYIILVVVLLWCCRNLYKKFKGEASSSGCSGGCGGCSVGNDSCDGVKNE